MEEEQKYQVIITNEGILIFMIKSRPVEPERPFVLYDGGKHATLYFSEDETMALDNLDERIIPILDEAEKILVFEMDDEIQDISRIYEAGVKHIKKNVFVD